MTVKICLYEVDIDCFYVAEAIRRGEVYFNEKTKLWYEDGKLEYCTYTCDIDGCGFDCWDITRVISECREQSANPEAWDELVKGAVEHG